MSRADTREDKRRLEPLRRAGWEITALHYGDYEMQDAIGKTVLVEHKTMDKFVADMMSGTLARQCRGVVEHSDFPILMVEGHIIKDKDGCLANSRITWKQFWNQLRTIKDMGCRYEPTSSMNDSIERLFDIEEYYKREKHDSALRQVSGDPYVVALSLIDGVGQMKAKALEVIFPTLARIAAASPGQLREAKGIDSVLAQRIWQFFRTDYVRKDLEMWE